MKTLLLLLLLLPGMVFAAENEAEWSKPVNGLRARLSIQKPREKDSPFYRVFMEFQNVDRAAGQIRIRFDHQKLKLCVTGREGKVLPSGFAVYDGRFPLWEPIALPYEGTIRFRISFPGTGYRPGIDKAIIDVGIDNVWAIPQDGSTYSLSGSLTISRQEGDHPTMDWSGTLELPKVRIPKVPR